VFSIFARSLLLIFFFSSRRRHTRSKRDWSSDVCSSDLKSFFHNFHCHLFIFSNSRGVNNGTQSFGNPSLLTDDLSHIIRVNLQRSEERRVGKESSWMWSSYKSIEY